MSEITIKYHPDYDSSREDAVFYADGADCMACIGNGTQTFHVRVCGDTKALVWPTAEACNDGHTEAAVVRSGDEWKAVGITTEQELHDAADRIEWVYNSWYEIRPNDSNDEDVFDGDVFHTVYDAVEEIKAYFEQQGTAHVHQNGVVELDPADVRATVCGTCGRAWDDSVSTAVTPTPAGRCPFEYDHPEPVEPSADLLYRINDALTAICDEAGITLYDDVLNDLTWTVARSLTNNGERDEA